MSSPSTNREKPLILLAGCIVFAIVLWLLNDFYGSSFTKLRTNLARKKEENTKYEQTIERAASFEGRLANYGDHTLPLHDINASSSRYRNWVIDTVHSVNVKESRVDPSTVKPVKEGKMTAYCIFPYTVKFRGSLGQAMILLEKFYAADFQHQITAVSLKPRSDSSDVDASISIEVLGLPQTPAELLDVSSKENHTVTDFSDSTDGVAATTSDDGEIDMNGGGVMKPVVESKTAVSQVEKRAFFTVYRPPVPPRPATPPPSAPPPPPARPPFDVRPYVFIGAIVEASGRPQVWIDLRTEGRQQRLFEGESFRVGDISCMVTKINDSDIEVATTSMRTNYRFRLGLGETFYDAESLGPVQSQ